MKEWEFSNHIETNVSCEDPAKWLDIEEARLCPPGWMLVLDAENTVVAMAPPEVATMLTTLFNSIEKTNTWEDPHG